MRGPGLIYYNPGDIYGASFGLSEFGRSIKDKFKNYLNKRKGYQLTKTTEDFIVCLTNIITYVHYQNNSHKNQYLMI